MRHSYILIVCLALLSLTGCTEMRVEGDSTVFQESAVSSVVRTIIGLVLVVFGLIGIYSGFFPDRNPHPHRPLSKSERTTPMTRAFLFIFGFKMLLVGSGLSLFGLLFSEKEHVTVFPDRVEFVTTVSESAKGGIVIPFENLRSIDLDEVQLTPIKTKTYIVYTKHDSTKIRHELNKIERTALDTIRQAFAGYRSKHPATEAVATKEVVPEPSTSLNNRAADRGFGRPDRPLSELESLASSIGKSSRASDLSDSWQNPIATSQEPSPSTSLNSSAQTYSTDSPRSAATIREPVQQPKEFTFKRYPISIPILKGYSLVESDTAVVNGLKLGACYARRWENVTVVAANEDGTITCNWDNWPGFTYKMTREDLIINDTVKLKLQVAITASRPQQEREWMDATGKFKVVATYVSSSDNVVTLRKSDNSEIDVPIAKLCKEDRLPIHTIMRQAKKK